ncbi:CG2790 [Drosophila busckii]|uniref:CG2790 n=1 Tax=Drosophila busckii TaxID=30019 RepID=A0A0M4EFZ0_DROBS|nr:dnaJ homolog subfamily C member 21 [Drosophila busckii]ALC42364.1 CG2790 [Drosophila busckii]
MRCYYEELGVTRDSNEKDIKAAYRKLALKWHPDKNQEVEAKERFQHIQQAYDVLSDAQERAWYDNHREQILRGKNSEYSENCLDVFQFFTSSCYKGFGNDTQGFYTVYRDVFNKIAAEDMEFADSDEERGAPQFGNAESNYEEVVAPFYAYWQAYSTRKTYEWLCPYDVRDIKERFILRKVEKEMKKIVQNARKERNDEVRNLVSFVRKRDRRVQAYRRVLEDRAEANRLKQQEKRQEQLRQRQQQLAEVRANKEMNDGYEEQLRQLEQQYDSETDEYTDEDESQEEDDLDDYDSETEADGTPSDIEYVDDLYCVACNKSFKNAKARANHEESKKHRENVERLRQQMTTEEEEFNKQSDEPDIAHLDINVSPEEEDVAEEPLQQGSKRNKKNKKSKKPAAQIRFDSSDEETAAEHLTESPSKSEENDDWSNSKKSTKKTKSKKTSPSNKGKVAEGVNSALEPKIEKQTKPSAALISGDEETLTQHVCVTCKLSFESKNKLFAHLKKTNHGVYIPKSKPDVEGKPPAKGKGKRK